MVKDFGKYFKELRKQSGMTLTEFSKKYGYKENVISLLENSKVVPRPTTIKKIADIYGVDYLTLYKKLEKGE